MARAVDAEGRRTRVARIFERFRTPPEDAAIVADHLVEADLRGVHSHGVIRVPRYVEEIRERRINVRPNVRIVADGGGQVVMDADHAFGQLAALRANQKLTWNHMDTT